MCVPPKQHITYVFGAAAAAAAATAEAAAAAAAVEETGSEHMVFHLDGLDELGHHVLVAIELLGHRRQARLRVLLYGAEPRREPFNLPRCHLRGSSGRRLPLNGERR